MYLWQLRFLLRTLAELGVDWGVIHVSNLPLLVLSIQGYMEV